VYNPYNAVILDLSRNENKLTNFNRQQLNKFLLYPISRTIFQGV